MTVAQFNRKHRSQVFRFANENRTIVDRMLGLNKKLHVPLRKENPHFLIMGHNTAGKTQLIFQQILQIESRNELAIVHDPGQEYTPRFYKPERGDVILNPFDQRMPFWSICDEVRTPAEALAVGACLFPDRHNLDPFLAETPRKIFAHLLAHNPTPQQLIQWMSDPAAIDRLVAETPYATRIGPQSPGHRNSVLGFLHRVADALRFLPTEKETKTRWNTAEWSKTRTGWVFLPSTNSTREGLMPLVSLWLDLLVMRLFDESAEVETGSPRPVWFVLDEVASLQNLPKLHDAMTRNHKTNNPVVLGIQRRSQLQKHHGLDAEAMLSEPRTKIFLRTSEPESAKWISDTIGEVEIEQLRERRWREQWQRSRSSKNYQLERRIEPLVLASQITGLEDRRGYLKSGNAVVPLSFPDVNVPKVQPALIERVPEVLPEETPKTTAAAVGANGSPTPVGRPEGPEVLGQRPNQDKPLEPIALPAKRRFFE